jgi:hypothetical protein
MKRTIPDEIDAAGFEAKLAACGDSLRELVVFLRASSQHAGVTVTQRRFRHPEPNTGWGVTYYVVSKPFCEIHPKAQDGHAWVRLPGVNSGAVASSGFEPSKQEGWFRIRSMGEAVRFVHWILQAHDARVSTARASAGEVQ